MATTYQCRAFTKSVDLAASSHKLIIEVPMDVYYFEREMRVECLSIDSGGSSFLSKPGKIGGSRMTPGSGKSEIEYLPDEKTLPGRYRLHVDFKQKHGNGQYFILGTCKYEFRVTDSTKLSFATDRGQTSHLIDLNQNGDRALAPVKLYLQGPRNEKVKLELGYEKDESGFSCMVMDPKTIGGFDRREITLSGAGKTDEVIYYPGPNIRSGQIVATALCAIAPYKLRFNIRITDAACNVFYQNQPISQMEKIPVYLEHSLSTAFASYRTTLSGKFSIVGTKESSVAIKMNWNGAHCGHQHDLGSENELATGKFTNFNQQSGNWVPDQSLRKDSGTVDYRDISYVTYGLCGEVKVVVSFKNRENAVIEARTFYLSVMYPGLKKLEAGSEDNIILDGKTDSHPDNHYGTQKLIDAIRRIAKDYGEACDRGEFNEKGGKQPQRKLYVNDMSLVFGGRFDHKHNLMSPHEEHMFGEEVDIQTNEMNQKQRDWFLRNARGKAKSIEKGKSSTISDYGLARCDGEPSDSSPHHFHCSIVSEY